MLNFPSLFSPVLESLEPRLAPAGVITAVLAGGVLKLTGDVESNTLTVEEVAPDVLRITGSAGTTINFGAQTGLTTVDITAGVGLTVDLKDGSDSLTLTGLSLTGALGIHLGNGNNQLTAQGLQVGGNLSITGLGGTDTLVFGAARTDIGGTVNLNLGDGVNSMGVSGKTTFAKGFAYAGGTGADNLQFACSELTVIGATTINVGAGGGAVVFSGSQAEFKGAVSVTSLAHTSSSTVTFTNNNLFFNGGLTIKQGAGQNFNTIASGTRLEITGALNLTDGDAFGVINTTTISAPAFEVSGAVALTMGSGFHRTTFGQIGNSISIGGKLTVTHGDNTGVTGTSEFTMTGGNAEIRGGMLVTNKTGEYLTSLNVTNLSMGTAALTVTNLAVQNGDRTSTLISATGNLTAGSISITNAAGQFQSRITVGTGQVTGGILIKNGNAVSGVATVNSITGGLNVGGSIGITNGAGLFDNLVSANGILRVGGSLSVTNGFNDSNSVPTKTTLNGVDASAMSIKGAVTLLNGAGLFDNNFEVRNFSVGGALNITHGDHAAGTVTTDLRSSGTIALGGVNIKNGAGLFANELEAENLIIKGAVNIKNGNTNDAVTRTENILGGGRVTIGGATTFVQGAGNFKTSFEPNNLQLGAGVSLTGSNGTDILQFVIIDGSIKGNITANYGEGASTSFIQFDALSMSGGISLSALGGNDSLTLRASGHIGGGVSTAFGVSADSSVLIDGNRNAVGTPTLLTIHGAVGYTASAASARDLTLQHVAVGGAFALTGSSAIDEVTLVNAQLLNTFKLDLLGAADTVKIDDSIFRSSFTYLGGAGDDVIRVESGTNTGPTVFQGAVNIQMGDGADALLLGLPGNANTVATFKSTAVFDGGLGLGTAFEVNSYAEGANVTFQGSPKVLTNFAEVSP